MSTSGGGSIANGARERSRTWSNRIRSELEQKLGYLRLDAQTEEEQRDVRRMVDLMNDICEKHRRRSLR